MATESTAPFHLNTVSLGIEQDINPELTGSTPGNGLYLDGHNTRPVSVVGNTGTNEKIQGEEILYPNDKGLTDYECIGTARVNDYIVECWAPKDNVSAGIIVVNGVVVLKSIDFELRTTHPLQMDVNQSPLNQEIFITDNRVPPYIFNVKDMVDAVGTPTYFTAFDPLVYQINLSSPLDRPKFIELINVGEGLPTGQYEYHMRYSTEAGDRTGWSQGSGLIPVIQGLSTDSRCYPWSKTYGGPPNPSSKTAFAPRLKFRVNNLYNYDFIEIKRTPYNQGAGIQFVPQGTVVYRTAIGKQEVSVREFVDPQDQNETILISEANETQQLSEIESCKSIKYFDRRAILMNVKLASKESNITFLKINNKVGFPVIDWIGKGSHKDPWNHVNRKSYMGGERYGFGAVLFDGVGTSGFVTKTPDFKDYQYPNRRDTVSTETNNYSLEGTSQPALDTQLNVTKTHEVFDLRDATAKSDVCNFKNIIRKGQVTGLTGTRSTAKVKEDCDEDNGEIENHGANVALAEVSVSYQPYTPVKQSDNDVTGHEYVTNTKVATDADEAACTGESLDYRPPAMAPDYYSHGMMFAGIDNFPKWAKAFSVVRTPAANRVICQGLGFYSMTQAKYKTIGSATLGGKETNKLWFYSPDIEQGIVASNTLNDIIDNPQNYKLQMVSPLGFFSEVYSFEDNLVACNRDRLIDMITYVRMTRDLNTNKINPGEDASMGYNPGDGYSYPGYDIFRNYAQPGSAFIGQPDMGNRIFGLASVSRKVEGRGQFIELETEGDLYAASLTGGSTERQFDDAGLKKFTEPMYIINIIRVGAQIEDTDVQGYKSTGHYQKLESIIGKGNGLVGQIYPLVDERWEDCIPSPKAGQYGSATNRYLYVKKSSGVYDKWINVTYLSAPLVATIEAAILANGVYGTDIKGVYKHINVQDLSREFQINFYHSLIFPQLEELIIVKYDNTAPIRVYGGDTYISETIFSPLDRVADAKADAAETQFAWGIGFPYFKWKINPRQYTIRKAGAAINVIQDALYPKLGYIRQLCAMFCCETRAGIHYSFNTEYPNQFFPLMNYVIRPNRWDDTKNTIDNGVFQGYVDDYGLEYDAWKYGGFRFLQQINPDYSCEPAIKFFSKPEFGFIEETNFPTGIMHSLSRAVNIQNSPGLRTFPANNFFAIDDNYGEIKFAYDDTTEKGENLYSITERGVCMLITKKSILSDLNSSELGLMAVDSFIRGQYWLNKETGMNDEMWRSAVWAFVPTAGDQGDESRHKALFFANKLSVYSFAGNVVTDIGRQGYYRKLYNNGVKNIESGFTSKVTCAYNKLHNEYWLYMKSETDDVCFVWGQKNGRWHGTNDFKFDRFISKDNQIFGCRDLKTYELNKGYIINDAPIESRLTGASSPEQNWDKEFIAIRANTSVKPTEVEFYKELDGVVQCAVNQATQGPLYMKNYRGYEAQIPRIIESVNTNRDRLQGRLLIWNIIHNEESEFSIINVSVQYKKLKIK